jgi:hypothetical protein
MNPWIVALASLVPGLGFAIQAKMREAVLSFALVAGLFVVYFLAPWEIIYQVSCGLIFMAWIGQGYFAFNTARREIRVESRESQKPRQGLPLASPPPHLPRAKRISFRARQVSEQQLRPEEEVKAAVFGTAQPKLRSHVLLGAAAALTMKQYYVALTDTNVVFIQLDMWGKPAKITRQERTDVRSASFKKGFLSDNLILQLSEGKALKLQLVRDQQDEARIFAEELKRQ